MLVAKWPRGLALIAWFFTCTKGGGAEEGDTQPLQESTVPVQEKPVSRPEAATRSKELSPLQIELPSPINDLERRIGYAIDGYFSNRYRLRWAPGERDQDLYQNLYFRLGNPDKDRVNAVFLGRLSEDIDGGRHRTGFSLFDEITDSYDDNVNGRFYLGYLDLRRFGFMDAMGVENVRGGRQTYDETADTLVFDGGRLDSRAFQDLANLRLTAYGGLPVHYFESSPAGDVVTGAAAEIAPFRGTRARVDWTYLEDRREDVHARDHLLSAALWQSLGDRFNLHGRYNLLDGDTRDYLVRGTYREEIMDFLLQATFRHAVKVLRDLSVEVDPFFSVAREYRPFWEVDVRASQGIGRHFVVDGGIDLRELVHEDDEGTFNHEFIRYHLSPSTRDWPFPGTSISLTGEMWQSKDNDFFTVGGEVSQSVYKALVLGAGSYYSLYKFDVLSEQEKTDVRTFFGRIEYRLSPDVRLNVLYQLEKDDLTTYHTLDVGVRYSF